jgi:hypothetical protein
MFENRKNLENELKEKKYIFLGWENGWGGEVKNGVYYQNDPVIMKKCEDLKHERKDIQMNASGSLNIRYCEICGYYSKYDCSG